MVKAKPPPFVDEQRVREAIVRAEQETTAPIAVTIAGNVTGDVRAAALRALRRRGHDRAPERNAVHFYVVPGRRAFAVVGDAGAHERLGQAAWDGVAATVEQHFRAGEPTAGLVAGIEEAGRHLARHFPR